MNITCKICGSKVLEIFKTTVLRKYNAQYYQCENCEFIQTEDPYWLSEAYNSAIAKLDIGLIRRNTHYSEIVENLILDFFNPKEKFLDYGGGYGIFVRMMRDKGFNFYRQDIYCENLFAEFFDLTDLDSKERFEAITAFEVFEHLLDPAVELEKMLSYTDKIIFTTELHPFNPTPESWWYFIPETGQHISLFSRKSLQALAARYKLHFYTDNFSLHLLSKTPFDHHPLLPGGKKRFQRIWKRKNRRLESLLNADFDYIRKKLDSWN